MDFERTRDFALIKRIVTTPRIWKDVVDDYSPSPRRYQPSESEDIWSILIRDQGEIVGLFVFEMRSATVYEIHGFVLPEQWLKGKATAAAAGSIEYMFTHSPCRRVVAHVPIFEHRTRLRFPPQYGMTAFGIDRQSFSKGGKLYDRMCFGISKAQDKTMQLIEPFPEWAFPLAYEWSKPLVGGPQSQSAIVEYLGRCQKQGGRTFAVCATANQIAGVIVYEPPTKDGVSTVTALFSSRLPLSDEAAALTEACGRIFQAGVEKIQAVGLGQEAAAAARLAGFVEEGVLRKQVVTEGRRTDLVLMGLLKEEWHGTSGGTERRLDQHQPEHLGVDQQHVRAVANGAAGQPGVDALDFIEQLVLGDGEPERTGDAEPVRSADQRELSGSGPEPQQEPGSAGIRGKRDDGKRRLVNGTGKAKRARRK